MDRKKALIMVGIISTLLAGGAVAILAKMFSSGANIIKFVMAGTFILLLAFLCIELFYRAKRMGTLVLKETLHLEDTETKKIFQVKLKVFSNGYITTKINEKNVTESMLTEVMIQLEKITDDLEEAGILTLTHIHESKK